MTTAVASPTELRTEEDPELKCKNAGGTTLDLVPYAQLSHQTPPRAPSSDVDMLSNEGMPSSAAGLSATAESDTISLIPPATIPPLSGYGEILSSALAYALPDDPANMEGLPLNRNENPFYMISCEGGAPCYPPTTVSFTRAPFPKVVIPFKSLIANLHPDLVNTIKMNPTDYLAIIPFGAGKKFNEDHPMAGALYTEFIKTFGLDLKGLTIAKPMPTTALKSDFGAPWVYILKGGSNDLQSFLLWQQTFAAKSKIAFSVVPFDTSPQSWIIANILSDAVSKDPKVMNRALGVIKKNLWLNQDFRRVAN